MWLDASFTKALRGWIWRVATQVDRWSQYRSEGTLGNDPKSKALCDESQSALEGSPPPELPNYACDCAFEAARCKYTLSN